MNTTEGASPSLQPPDVITWQLNNAAKLGKAANGFARQIDQHNARIAELEAEADEVKARAEKKLTELANTIADLKENRDRLTGKHNKELGERDVALRMVALWWQEAYPDAPLPPIPEEVPADATGPFPAVSPNGATQVIPAVRSYQPVPAETAKLYPHAVLWDKSRDLLICAEPDEGLICGQPVENAPCSRHAPADLDQVTASSTVPDGPNTDGGARDA